MKKISKLKNAIIKSTEYPVIYSYIYERESQDIKRLSNNFKNTRIKKISQPEVKTIIAYKIVDGKATPVYANNEETKTGKKLRPIKKNIPDNPSEKLVRTRATAIKKSMPKSNEDKAKNE